MHTYTRWRNPTPHTRKISDKDMGAFVLLALFWWALFIWLVLYDLIRLLIISQRKSGRVVAINVFLRFPTGVVIAACMVGWYLRTYWKRITG